MRLTRIATATWIVMSLCLLAGLPAWASVDRGAIQGTVADSQGAVVPNVAVEVTNTDTNVTVNSRTNDAGFFAAIELVPGNHYTVRFKIPGFKVVERTQVEVKAGTKVDLDIKLEVGDVAETVNIQSEAPLVEITASNFSSGIQSELLQTVPIIGRDIQTLVQLLPGITQSTGPSGSVFGFDSQFGGFPDPTHIVGSGISANGSQGGANAWYLDGTLNATLGPESVVVNPSPDAVAEFNVVNNGLAAEWSRTSGLVVNVVLKSGTNSFHGNVYDFNRNSYFSASNPFQRRDAQGNAFLSPSVNFNDFGGTIGGPIKKNKTFFFAAMEVNFLHETQPRIYTVPTARNRAGDFSDRPDLRPCDSANGVYNCLYDPYSTTGPDANGLFHRTPLPSLIIPADKIDPLAQFYVDSYPNPNFLDPLQQGADGCGSFCNNFLSAVGSSQTTQNISLKIDHNLTENSKLFGEYLLNPSWYQNFRLPWTGPTAVTTGIAGAQPYRTMNQIFTLGHTYTFRSTWINEARFSFSRQNQRAQQNPDQLVGNDEILPRIQGLNFVLDQFSPVPVIGVGGLPGFGPQQWQNGIQGVDAFTALDNMTKILGKHTLKAGLMWRRDRNWNLAGWGYNLGFGGVLSSDPISGQGGNGLAQFLLGAVDPGSGNGTYHAPYQSSDYWGFYVQDDYRITPSFTLNVGLRYDIFGWFRERSDALANFDFDQMNPQVPYKGRYVYFATPSHPDRNVFPSHKNSIAPRINFAWTPFDDKKTVIRGGYDLIYSNGISVAFGTQNGAISAPAFANYFGYHDPDFFDVFPAFQFSKGAPDLGIPPVDQVKKDDNQFLGLGTGGGFLNGSKDPYVQQWSLYVQRELPSNMVLSVGYVGTHGLHLYGDEFRNRNYVATKTRQQLRTQINQVVPTPSGLVPAYGAEMPLDRLLQPYPQYGAIGVNSNPDGFNRYNSLQTRLEKRLSQGLSFIAVYTFQKNIGTPNTGSLIGNTATPTTLGRTVGRSAYVPGAISGGSGNVAGGARAQDPDNRFADVALTADDIPQIFNAAVLYELPFGKGKPFLSSSRAANVILGGWQLTQNWNVQSGVPMPISAPCNGIESCRPNLIGDPQFHGSRSRQEQENQWWNPAAFEAPFGSNPAIINAPDPSIYDEWWRYGNMGLRIPSVRSPGFWNLDVSLSKSFHLTESRYFIFRWEIYNALNHQNLGIPDSNWCLPPNSDGSTDLIHVFGCQFGKITNVQTDPRAMQFGLKFYW